MPCTSLWENPYANVYQVEYWLGRTRSTSIMGPRASGKSSLPAVKNGAGGAVTLKLAQQPVNTQFVRVLMTESSNTCDLHGSDDVRNCVGYAMQEIQAGTIGSDGAFIDVAAGAVGDAAPYIRIVVDRSVAFRRGRQCHRELPAQRL